MKSLFVVLLITVYTNFCLAEDDKLEFPSYMTECLKENGFDGDFFKKVINESKSFLIENSKCLSFCVMEKTNLLDDTKHIKTDELKKRFSSIMKSEEVDKLEKIAEMCPDIHSEMNCDTARNLDKCIAEM